MLISIIVQNESSPNRQCSLVSGPLKNCIQKTGLFNEWAMARTFETDLHRSRVPVKSVWWSTSSLYNSHWDLMMIYSQSEPCTLFWHGLHADISLSQSPSSPFMGSEHPRWKWRHYNKPRTSQVIRLLLDIGADWCGQRLIRFRTLKIPQRSLVEHLFSLYMKMKLLKRIRITATQAYGLIVSVMVDWV